MATAKPVSVVDGNFYTCLKILNDCRFRGISFADAQSALSKESALKLSYAERLIAYFSIPASPGYGVQVESCNGSPESRNSARFELRYAAKNPIDRKKLWTSSKLESIFSDAHASNLSLEQVAEALDKGGLVTESQGTHYRNFSAQVSAVSAEKDGKNEGELLIPGTLFVDVRETPKFAHDRYSTEFMMEIHARLIPELARPPAKQLLNSYAGTPLGSVKRNP